MYRRLFFALTAFFLLAATPLGAARRFTLVIDPGHGGHDAGAMGAISKEKDINLNVALAFGRYVERNCPDVRVIYTRKTDVFVPLNERAQIANRANADLFVSVHTNALPGGKIARGFETYTLGMHRAKDNLDVAMRENSVISMEKGYRQTYQGFNPKSSESYIMFEFIQGKNMERSIDLARYIQRNVCAGGARPDKGVHQAGFLVLRETSMPGCLIELGFITTPDEERFLKSSEGISSVAEAIYRGFLQYKNRYDDRITVPYKADKQTDVDVPTVVPQQPEPMPAAVRTDVGNPDPRKEMPVVKAAVDNVPVFKVQILASSRELRPDDAHFKGETEVGSYKEGDLVKYTLGASTNYNEIAGLRKSVLEKFPEAFIIAFKDGRRMDVNEAIREFKNNRGK